MPYLDKMLPFKNACVTHVIVAIIRINFIRDQKLLSPPTRRMASSRRFLAALFLALGFALFFDGSNSPLKSLGKSFEVFAYRSFD